MFKKIEKTMKIVPFWHRFVAKLLVVRQFDGHNSTCHSLIFKNPNFHRSSVCLVRVINLFRRPPKKNFPALAATLTASRGAQGRA